jgi:hypothetical protein
LVSDPSLPNLEDILHDVPVEYRDRFEGLLGQSLQELDDLRAEVESYLETVRRVGPLVALIDVGEAEQLGEATVALMNHLEPGQPALFRQLVQSAVHYFVREEEDEEITGVLGFDDDIQVVNAVCRALGRHDLVIPLSRPPL